MRLRKDKTYSRKEALHLSCLTSFSHFHQSKEGFVYSHADRRTVGSPEESTVWTTTTNQLTYSCSSANPRVGDHSQPGPASFSMEIQGSTDGVQGRDGIHESDSQLTYVMVSTRSSECSNSRPYFCPLQEELPSSICRGALSEMC